MRTGHHHRWVCGLTLSLATALAVATAGCGGGSGTLFSLSVPRPSIGAGDIAISSANKQPAMLDSFGLAVVTDGSGYAVGATAGPAPDFEGTVHIDSTANPMKGTITLEWSRVGTMSNGAVQGSADRAGGAAAAFEFSM